MRYFKIYDDLSPGGDLYRFNGIKWECLRDDGTWVSSWAAYGTDTAWMDLQVKFGIEGGNPDSRWEEIDEPG